QRCFGGRVNPGRDYAAWSPSRGFEWQLRQVRTVHRRETGPSRSDLPYWGPPRGHLWVPSHNSDPAAAAKEVKLDEGRHDHRRDSNREGQIRRLEHVDEVREVHAVEAGEEAQRKKQAGD